MGGPAIERMALVLCASSIRVIGKLHKVGELHIRVRQPASQGTRLVFRTYTDVACE